MGDTPKNLHPTSALTTDDVDAAIARIGTRNQALAGEVEHIVASLTWAKAPVENALEDAIADDRLVVGARGWRTSQPGLPRRPPTAATTSGRIRRGAWQ